MQRLCEGKVKRDWQIHTFIPGLKVIPEEVLTDAKKALAEMWMDEDKEARGGKSRGVMEKRKSQQ